MNLSKLNILMRHVLKKSSMSLGMVVALSREIAVKFSTIEHVLGYNICHYLGYGVVYLSIIIIRCISTLVVKKLAIY